MDRREHGDLTRDGAGSRGIVVYAVRFECGALESGERCAELFVGAAVHATSHRAKKRVQCERERAIYWRFRLVIAPQEFDVDILIERSRKPLAGCGKHAPPSAAVRRVVDCRIVGGIAEPKERKRLE